MAVPTLDSRLVTYVANWKARLATGASDFGLAPADVTAFDAVAVPYLAASAALNSPGAKSQALYAERDAARRALLPVARQYYDRVGSSVDVSDANKLLLGITIRKQPVSQGPPVEYPILEIGARWGTTVEVDAHGAHSRRGKPVGCATWSLFQAVGAQPPATAEGWDFTGSTSRSKIEVTLPANTPPGTVVWFCGFFANRKGESGPVSSPISAIIAGGGATVRQAA